MQVESIITSDMLTKKYNFINNLCGWVIFVIALVTYWLTLEPTASYWDCGEFIIQADKLEVGHPPGNPIFMLTARFFANFATSQATVALMVNAMSGLLSALTILLLFWTITHLTRRLVLGKDDEGKELNLTRYLVIMGSGVAGALAYAWSDTFWFSAVEGEVYAFSSFCTALVFWLILKWENRADSPHSDRYLILIAYIIGVSVGVHLLNLLCIPAIALVFAYRKFENMNLKKSIYTLLISFAIIFLILFGLVPGFMKVAQQFELLFVNGFGMGYNSGTIVYTILTVVSFLWCLYTLEKQNNALHIRISFIVAVAFSGMLSFTSSLGVWILALVILAVIMFTCFKKGLPVRIFRVIMWSMALIFVGYSSYALILIRSSADTPMNQNSPDNVFDLASYLNREQYGENPLIYGNSYTSESQKRLRGYNEQDLGTYQGQVITLVSPSYEQVVEYGKAQYTKGVDGAKQNFTESLEPKDIASNMALSQRAGKPYYMLKEHKANYKLNPELDTFFPRLYSRLGAHRTGYQHWVPSLKDSSVIAQNMVQIYAVDAETGAEVPELDTNADYIPTADNRLSYPNKQLFKPTFLQNLQYFFDYQVNHMYMRYFLWNFAGRQNDLNNQWGEMDAGNWISGIPFIDNNRLGDQSLLPDDLGKNNKGHNVYYMLPLLLGIIGLLWQSFKGQKGIEQFWVVFFLFFMTGLAIVIYLNQPPNQPRERDYAFAGSFYAFAIWIGMGVAGIWQGLKYLSERKNAKADGKKSANAANAENNEKQDRIFAIVAAVIGLAIPIQMVSQTWDDHDRSGRYAARDFAINYLESTEPNAIIFCNGDNDTFPLWYAQEVEGVRPDVKILNLSYLASDWYANQALLQSYDAAPVKMMATPKDYAYGNLDITVVGPDDNPMPLTKALEAVYSGYGLDKYGYPTFPTSVVYIPIDKDVMVKRGYVAAKDTASIEDRITIDLSQTPGYRSKHYISLSELLMLDIIATNAANGWERPIYWASTVGDEYYMNLHPYMTQIGMVLQLTPQIREDKEPRTDLAYDVITKKYRWGGADVAEGKRVPYFDETAGRMLAGMRGSILATAQELTREGDAKYALNDKAGAAIDYKKALTLLNLLDAKLSERVLPYELQTGPAMAELYCQLGSPDRLDDKKALQKGLDMLRNLLIRFAQYIPYEQNISMLFGNVMMTTTTSNIPYRFYNYAEIYKKYGGDLDALLKLPQLKGVNMQVCKQKWDQLSGQTGGDESPEEILRVYAQQVGEFAKMSPAEYNALADDYRLQDSLFYEYIDLFITDYGLTQETVDQILKENGVDMTRAKRLRDAYVNNHPELLQ